MKVVVGLGNPGREYERTRHNVGFDVLSELARRHTDGRATSKFEAQIVEAFVGSEKLLLVAPQTYMNLSGRSVGKLLEFYKLEPEHLLVVCDDLNLDVGRLRLRPKGSAGGQKGLNHIIQCVGTQEVARLRIGIGRPPGRMSATDYVLSRFRSDERDDVDHALVGAADGVELWATDGLDAAMNRVNAPADDE